MLQVRLDNAVWIVKRRAVAVHIGDAPPPLDDEVGRQTLKRLMDVAILPIIPADDLGDAARKIVAQVKEAA